MGLPVDQSVGLIATEALRQAGYENPSPSLVVRAGDEWLRRVLQQMAKRADLTLYEETKVAMLLPYQSRYALPDDCDRISGVLVYSGGHTGSLASASASGVTLDALENAGGGFVKGRLLFITSGAAQNAVVRLVSFDESTKLAGVAPSFSVLPVAGDNYMIADIERQVVLVPEGGCMPDEGLPGSYYIFGRTPLKEIYFDRAVREGTRAAVKIRYTVYPHKVDLADVRMTTVYNELQSELTQGLLAYALMDMDDARAAYHMQLFEKMMNDYFRKNQAEKISGMKMFQPA